MRSRRIFLGMIASGLTLIAATGAYAQAAPTYGTGSADRPGAQPMSDKIVQASKRSQAALDKQREKLIRQVAEGDVKALTPLAGKLEYGDDTHAPDEAGALDLYQKAADLGSAVGLSRICNAYILGEGRPHDPVRGLAYCDKLTDDSPAALFAQGYAVHEGVGKTIDMTAATALFIKAVAAGSGPAADMLGRDALAAGKVEEARTWFRKGVYRESVDALDDMARLVEAGQGGPVDRTEAYWLYMNAARRGNAYAQDWVGKHPDAVPAPRLVLEQGKTVTGITETYTDEKGRLKTRPVDVVALHQRLPGYYPKQAVGLYDGSYASIDCYVNAVNKIDACWLRRQDPPGYAFGRVIEQLFEGDLTLTEKDAVGLPTAQHVFIVAIQWGDIH